MDISLGFKVIGKNFKGNFRAVSRVFQESLHDASRKNEGCCNGILSGFLRVFKRSWMGV